jgi:thioredoxin-related protein
MKSAILTVVAALSMLGFQALAADWEADFAQAQARAAKEGKFLLVDFSGSDWCGWCIKLDKEVFSKAEFQAYAKDKLVLALVDFPRKTPLPEKAAAANKALASKYKVEGFPTVILMLPDGTEVARTGYQEGGPVAYVAHLKELLTPHQGKLPKPAAAATK